MWEYVTPVRSDELYHHGVKDMHWGIRRYQYLDGTYTPEGKARYAAMRKAADKARENGKSGYMAGLATEYKIGQKKRQKLAQWVDDRLSGINDFDADIAALTVKNEDDRRKAEKIANKEDKKNTKILKKSAKLDRDKAKKEAIDNEIKYKNFPQEKQRIEKVIKDIEATIAKKQERLDTLEAEHDYNATGFKKAVQWVKETTTSFAYDMATRDKKSKEAELRRMDKEEARLNSKAKELQKKVNDDTNSINKTKANVSKKNAKLSKIIDRINRRNKKIAEAEHIKEQNAELINGYRDEFRQTYAEVKTAEALLNKYGMDTKVSGKDIQKEYDNLYTKMFQEASQLVKDAPEARDMPLPKVDRSALNRNSGGGGNQQQSDGKQKGGGDQQQGGGKQKGGGGGGGNTNTQPTINVTVNMPNDSGKKNQQKPQSEPQPQPRSTNTRRSEPQSQPDPQPQPQSQPQPTHTRRSEPEQTPEPQPTHTRRSEPEPTPEPETASDFTSDFTSDVAPLDIKRNRRLGRIPTENVYDDLDDLVTHLRNSSQW